MKAKIKINSPTCSVCHQPGGPLEARQDGKGYRHSYGCKDFHLGKQCPHNPHILTCQEEDGCSECEKFKNRRRRNA